MSDQWDDIGFVISSRYRVLVLGRLAEGPATPSRIAEDSGFAIAHVSRTLGKLRERTLVKLLVPEDRKMRTSTTCMDAAVHYIERHSPIGNNIDDRWTRDDAAELDPALAAAMEGMEPLAPPEEESGGAYQ